MNQFIPTDQFFEENSVIYQKRKLLIDNIRIEESAEKYEQELLSFLSSKGPVKDIKILKNCMLISYEQRLCTRNLRE